MIRGMWVNSEEILIKKIEKDGKIISAYIANFKSPKGSGRIPLILEDGSVCRSYWLARCVISIPDLGVSFESFGNRGMATKKEATVLAKAMATAI